MLKSQKKENFNEENDKIGLIIRKNQGIVNKAEEIKEKIEENLIKESQKMDFLRKKNLDIAQKAEEIKEKLDNFQSSSIKKQNIRQNFDEIPE